MRTHFKKFGISFHIRPRPCIGNSVDGYELLEATTGVMVKRYIPPHIAGTIEEVIEYLYNVLESDSPHLACILNDLPNYKR